jgi:hypothetical protein
MCKRIDTDKQSSNHMMLQVIPEFTPLVSTFRCKQMDCHCNTNVHYFIEKRFHSSVQSQACARNSEYGSDRRLAAQGAYFHHHPERGYVGINSWLRSRQMQLFLPSFILILGLILAFTLALFVLPSLDNVASFLIRDVGRRNTCRRAFPFVAHPAAPLKYIIYFL